MSAALRGVVVHAHRRVPRSNAERLARREATRRVVMSRFDSVPAGPVWGSVFAWIGTLAIALLVAALYVLSN
jgi:hypothetical protein